MSGPRRNVDDLSPLLTISKCLAVLPSSLMDLEMCKCRYLHGFVLIGLILYFYTTAIVYKYNHPFLTSVAVVIDFLMDIMVMTTSIACIAVLNLMNGRKLIQFHSDIRLVDKNLRFFKEKQRYPNLKFYIEMFVMHIMYAWFLIYGAYTWLKLAGWEYYRSYIVRDILYYILSVVAMLLRQYALCIQYRFELLADVLKSMVMSTGITVVDSGYIKNRMKYTYLGNRVYTKLTCIVDQYNHIFGWHYINIYLLILLNILMPVNCILVYGSGQTMLLGNTLGADLVSLCILWLSMPIFTAFGLYSACDSAAAAASKIPKLCFALVHDLRLNDGILKSELLQLANQASISKPEFSAAGFFTLNYGVIFGLVGAVSSYVIVLIQFN